MRRITPNMTRDVAQRIVNEECGDLKATWMLLDLAEAAYEAGAMESAATLLHAVAYIQNRIEYEQHPWPKNQVSFEYVEVQFQRGSRCQFLT